MRLIEVNVLKEWIENWFTKNRLYHPYAKNNNIPITELYDILEQMPTAQPNVTDTNVGDMINRQDAINALCKRCELVSDNEPCTEECNDIKILKLLPSVQQWIPVSEGLPHGSCSDLVNVSIHDDSGDTPFDYTSCGWVITDGEYWIVDNEINNHVIAWMPLPKPWKGEER